MKIHVLDESLLRLIAAGEVIERPASVVKELVENSLDAKSESISVELEEGGTRSIVVRDDGEGMDEEDLLLCVRRHATSKIGSEGDLERIGTLGFRGEALASVLAVARVRIVSCASLDQGGHEVRGEAESVEGPFPASRGRGTTVEVRDLFFNLPARARFVASARTELVQVSRIVERMALASPGIAWTLKHEKKTSFEAPAVGSLLERIGQVYGVDVARALLPVEAERGGIRIRGYVSRPDLRRGNRRDQHLFVNGRPISDRGLSFVLQSAYVHLLRPGAFPIACLFVDVPLDRVDVNVHPRKEEVRLQDARAVQDVLAQGLHQALGSARAIPSFRPGPREGERTAEPSVSYGGRAEEPPLPLRVGVAIRQSARDQAKVRVRGERRAIGQLLETYLLVEGPEGLEIVDQHIAHERVLYDALLAETRAGAVATQRFLVPVRLELPLERASLVAAAQEELGRLGIGLDDFGGGTFLLREYPSLLAERQAARGFQEPIEQIADLLAEGQEAREVLFQGVLARVACAAAVKARERLPLDEQQRLIEQLMALDDWRTCPHGRPIVFSLAREEIERRFERR